MKIFYSFLVIVAAAILFLLPVSDAVYAFRTTVRTDVFPGEATGGGDSTAAVVLLKDVYEDDTTTIEPTSSLSTDIPAYLSYNTTNRELTVSGLTVSENRTIYVDYTIDALAMTGALSTLADRLPWIWMLLVIGFVPAALVAIFMGKAD